METLGRRAAYRMQTTDSYDFGVFVFDADDVAVLRDNKTPTVRDNVLFELGLFIGSGSLAIDAREALDWGSVFYRFLAQVSVIRSFHPGQDINEPRSPTAREPRLPLRT